MSTEDLQKCPCCDNPWARATGDLFAQMCGDCAATTTTKKQPDFGLSRANMDLTVSSQDNFFQYANGTWMKENTIPAGYPNWNTFLALHVQSQERCQALLKELLDKSNVSDDAEAQKVALFYQAAMEEEKIEKDDIAPLQPILEHIEAIVAAKEAGDKSQYAALLGRLDAEFGVSGFFDIGASPDAQNSDHCIAQVYQGGLGLPDKDYYFDEDKQEKRDQYVTHVSKMLALLLQQDAPKDDVATAVYQLEEALAKAHMTRTENRDPHATYNTISIADLMTKTNGSFDFVAYFNGSTKNKDLGDINVRNVQALVTAAELMSTVESSTLRSYLQWHTVSSYAPYLSNAFVMENFNFYENILSGTEEIKPRWKRAMAFTEKALGEALGQLYCAKYFDESAKERAAAIVENVRKALEERLKEVEWMASDTTREEALKKMSHFRVKIGYPNKWIDYSTLVFETDDSFLTMVRKARAFAHNRVVTDMNAPTDRERWFLTPQTVNAYYHPALNEIVFPAAILQHPFFDPNADDAVNFGAMGAVVGHEMTHGFDDKGRKYNYAGVLSDWWTPEDAKEYEARVGVMVQQANAFEVHGKAVQGKLTSGENIADLGGLRLALRALRNQPNFDATKEIDGFTPVQRFFLAWAQCWRENISKERSLQLLTLDPHGPNEMRCNGPLSNMEDFHDAFGVAEGKPMFKPKEKRVDIW